MAHVQLPPLEGGFHQLGDKTHADHHDMSETKVFGFWLYLMTDCILFASLFATYTILHVGVAEGPTPKEIFELPFVLVETFLLLISSITFGFAMISAFSNDLKRVYQWLIVTALFGLGFLAMELYEFHHLISQGIDPTVSAFLSSFFTLVGTHGLHVTFGVIWLVSMLFLLRRDGLSGENVMRLKCLSLFWHFLDIIWICVFSLVYLAGVLQ
ncbi:cytochrome o ubiquinol oxidase subunit III [Pasteurellaceae bacterium TAE3-ERU1]|uniref:cytochrome o ubiquinol oxidase subunit III n=1 Tax=Spirabiliibacterium mucosae TaxID=28156 RepID=UPI001AAD3E99|nr:cytochrome o ubiquinol oxidase subunit III [Spirabiliibacterium mucosae]MBE2898514.1 cytochrome o ubiquinol oxidase subunit III [Spirabiliibacterium mucosae]MBV7388219.1 cytochrome o ubiquinol oxidase subunit III [Pasteurellaceae bacterium TAE3-ERU1]